jgi:hypothetical protein
LFSLRTELKANWMFQITEGEGRRQWLRAVDRFVFFGAVWARIAAMRREGWGELRLRYDEAPDPVVHGLNLLR